MDLSTLLLWNDDQFADYLERNEPQEAVYEVELGLFGNFIEYGIHFGANATAIAAW